MTDADLITEADALRAIIRQLELDRDAALQMWTSAVQDRSRLEDENRALRTELAMCPEARAEMAAWQPDDTSDLAYVDAPAPAVTWRWEWLALACVAVVAVWGFVGWVVW